MQQTVTLPTGLVQAGVWVKHNWQTALAVVIVAILASVVVEVIKHKGITTQDEAKAKRIITWLLVVFTTLFSWLSYAVFFMQTNLSTLQQLPIVGGHAVEALGVAYTLYNLRLNKYYKGFSSWAASLNTPSFGKKSTASLQSLPELQPEQPSDL